MHDSNTKRKVTMYSGAGEEVRAAARDMVIELRNQDPPKPYKECTKIVRKELGIEVTRNNIYNIMSKHNKKAPKIGGGRGKKPSAKPLALANKHLQDAVIKEIVDMIVDRARIRRGEELLTSRRSYLGYNECIRDILKKFNVRIVKDDIKDIAETNMGEIEARVKALGDRKEEARPVPKVIHTIEVETTGGHFPLEYSICNVVFSGTLDRAVDIGSFIEDPEVSNPKNFPGIVIKLSNPPSTVLLFQTGRFVSVGCTDVDQIEAVKNNLCAKVREKEVSVIPEAVVADVNNLVLTTSIPDFLVSGNGSAGADKLVDLNLLALQLDSCIYEPEVFPGLIHRLKGEDKKQRAVFLVFSSRKIVCVGISYVDEIPSILADFVRNLEKLGKGIYIDRVTTASDGDRFLDLSVI